MDQGEPQVLCLVVARSINQDLLLQADGSAIALEQIAVEIYTLLFQTLVDSSLTSRAVSLGLLSADTAAMSSACWRPSSACSELLKFLSCEECETLDNSCGG